MELLSIHRFRIGDILIGIVLLSGTFFSIPLMISSAPETVEVFRDSNLIANYPLREDKTFTIQGRKNPITISIRNKQVTVIRSSCPHHVCMQSGAISFPNAQIICAPNHIVITINSADRPKQVDGIAQ